MRGIVGQAHAAIWAALTIWFVFGTSVVSANAVEDSGRASVSRSVRGAQQAKPAAAEEEDDDEADTFFSGGAKSKVATVSPMTAPGIAAPRVDVIATCQAVLADNQSYYNSRFLEGCKRVVALNGRR